jgi:hypothetical protein
MPLSISDGALEWQRLAVLNHHPRDDRIQFEEETHTYTIDGVRKGWTSCTGFLHNFFGHFDADAVIAKMMASPDWYKKPYYGMTAEQIKKQWSDKGATSSAAGTRMHLDIEHFYNAIPVATDCALETEADYTRVLEVDKWVPNSSDEWTHFRNYHKDIGSKFKPFRTEWLVFDEEFRVAGSVDMVYLKPDGTLAIYDWKRAESIKDENKWQKGLGPLTHLPDTNYWHYSLQLNVYRYIIQKYYGFTVSELALVILHPINPTYKVMKLNLMDEEVQDMMSARKAALDLPGNDGSNPIVVL